MSDVSSTFVSRKLRCMLVSNDGLSPALLSAVAPQPLASRRL